MRRPGLMRLPPGSRVALALQRARRLESSRQTSPRDLRRAAPGRSAIVVPGGAVGDTSGTGSPASKVHLSSATLDRLDGVDGIGPTLAQRIIEYRDSHGGFRSLAELAQVEGIGEKAGGWRRSAKRSSRERAPQGRPVRREPALARGCGFARGWPRALPGGRSAPQSGRAGRARLTRTPAGASARRQWRRLSTRGQRGGRRPVCEPLDRATGLIRDGRPVSARAHLLAHPRPFAFGASAEARVARAAGREPRPPAARRSGSAAGSQLRPRSVPS